MTQSTTTELTVGQIVDQRYRIVRCLGRGGMGSVYEAVQIKLDRAVALKVLLPELASDEASARRFEREARAASAIDHRNVVKILDFGQLEDGAYYYSMELLQGRDLDRLLKESGPLPWSRCGWMVLQVVRALAAVHAGGIIHRDIKPANCFLLDPKPGDEPDLVKVLDFGIANMRDTLPGATELTGQGIIGTAAYMAPEQGLGGRVDARTDVYALGITMYKLLTGRVPFTGDQLLQVMLAHQRELPTPPRHHVPTIDPEVEHVVMRALQKRPEDRFASMAALHDALLPLVQLPGPMASVAASVPVAYPVGPSTTMRPTEVTTPSMAARPEPPPRPRSSPWRALLFGGAFVGLAAASALAVTWIAAPKLADREEEVAPPTPPEQARAEEPDAEAGPPRLAPPPPEAQYDPFADPFGAATLPAAPRVVAPPKAAGEDPEAAAVEPGTGGDAGPEPVALEELLPPESWTEAPGTASGVVLARPEGEEDPSVAGKPLAEAGVCAWIVDPRVPLDLRKKPRCTRTDRRGRFTLQDLPPSVYDLSVFSPGFRPTGLLAEAGAPMVVLPEQETTGLRLDLEPGGREVVGRVTDPEGEPVAGARVAAVGAARSLAVADASGSFSLWVDDGPLGVVAWATGYTDVVERGEATERFDLVLHREAILMGKVVWAESGEPVPGARVRAGSTDGLDPMVYTDASGLFSIPALPAGKYVPTARTDEGYGALDPVQLEAGTISPEVLVKLEPTAPAPVVEPPPPPPVVEPPPPPAPPEEIAPPVEAAPKVLTDGMRRRRLQRRLAKCGEQGRIELTAKYILENGALFLPEVKVSGGATEEARRCAEALAKGAEFRERRQPSMFAPIRVDL